MMADQRTGDAIRQPAPPGPDRPVDPRWLGARRVLLVRLDNLGDVLLCTPAFRAVRAALLEARLTLWASPAGAQALDLCPELDDALVADVPWMDVPRTLPQDPERELRLIREIRRRRFDGAIVFTSYHQSPLPAAYACYLAGVPLRHAESVDFPGSLLTSRHRTAPRAVHEVERALDLVAGLGFTTNDRAIRLRVPAEARAAVDARLAALAPGRGPLIVLHPGCTAASRTYPWQRYARAADLLIERLGARVVLTGGPAEVELVERLRAAMARPALSLAGQTSLAELAAVIAAADLLITNNTGPMHLAAGVGTPVVAPFALTNRPEQWGPWLVPHRLLFRTVPCAFCHQFVCPTDHACLLGVAPEEVAEAAIDLLAATRRGRSGAEPPAPAPAPQPQHHASWAAEGPVRRIAVFRALKLGDLLAALPALRSLRAAYPDAEITLIGLPWARDLVERLPYLDDLWEFPGWPGLPESPYDPARTDAFLARARARRFDLALQLHGDGRSSNGFVAALGARRTAGYRPADAPAATLDLELPYPSGEHEIDRCRRLVQALGAPDCGRQPEFPLSPDDRIQAERLLAPLGWAHAPLVGIHPGASRATRRWPPERFAALADALVAETGARVLLLGGPADRPVADAVRARLRAPALDLAGRTTLGGLAALLARLDLFVGNDSGPAHLAAALDVPSLILWGSADPGRWAPPERSRLRVLLQPVPCRPCGYDQCPIGLPCLREISVAAALAAARSLLAGAPVASGSLA